MSTKTYISFEEKAEIARLLEGVASRKGIQRSSIIREAVRFESGKFSDNLVTDYFNVDKPDQEKWGTRGIGRAIKRLGFKAKHMAGGRHGYLYDAGLMKQLLDRYDLPSTVNVTDVRKSLSSLTLDALHGNTVDHGKTASHPLKPLHDLAVGVSGG
jgi:hypothetical protein